MANKKDKSIDFSKYLHVVSNKMRSEISNNAKDGLTATQRKYLVYIILKSEVANVHARDLELEYNASKATISIVLKQLEKDGYIKSVEDKTDARFKIIKPTKKGNVYREHITEIMEDIEQRLVKNIDDKDLSTCIKVLKKIVDNIQQEQRDADRAARRFKDL